MKTNRADMAERGTVVVVEAFGGEIGGVLMNAVKAIYAVPRRANAKPLAIVATLRDAGDMIAGRGWVLAAPDAAPSMTALRAAAAMGDESAKEMLRAC